MSRPHRLRERTIDGALVNERRGELGTLSRRELLRIYERLPGRSHDQARRTLLSARALIDVIIWTEHGPGG
jgi:hypothetical protein